MNRQQDSHPDLTGTFGRVLIAVDNSATSQWALRVGGALAARLGATVGLLHVVDLSRGFAPELGVMDDRIVDELRKAGAELLERSERSVPAGLNVVRLMRDGEPAGEIVAGAGEWHADVVVLGAHARGALTRFLLGSTAEAVVRRAHCPVLTIGHDPAAPAGAPATPAAAETPAPAVAEI